MEAEKTDSDKHAVTTGVPPTNNFYAEEGVANVDSSKQKQFLITRLLQAFLPRSLTAPRSRSSPYHYAAYNPYLILDHVLFFTYFRLIWASALGHTLEAPDFPPLPPKRHVNERIASFNKAFARYQGGTDRKHGGQGSKAGPLPLLRSLLSVFKAQICEGLVCNGLWVGISMAHVLLYKVLLEYLLKFYKQTGPVDGHATFGEGVLYILAINSAIMLEAMLRMRGLYTLSVVGSEMRTLCAAAVTQKSLRISPLAMRSTSTANAFDVEKSKLEDEMSGDDVEEHGLASTWSTGTVLNLVNTDTERIQIAMKEFNKAWPILMAYPMVIGLSYWLIGWPGIAAFAVALLFVVPVVPLIRSLSRLRARLNAATDLRVNKVNDLVLGIRLLKAFAWEDIYSQMIRRVRHREAKLHKARVAGNGLVAILAECTGRASPILGVAIFSAISGTSLLESPNVVVFIQLYYTVGMFASQTPEAIIYLIDAWLSMHRIQEYLLATEVDMSKDLMITENNEKYVSVRLELQENAIEATKAQFLWKPSGKCHSNGQDQETVDTSRTNNDFVLHPVTISIRQSELIAITGTTSAGKSSLAAGFAGFMPLTMGQIARQSLPIYAPATPWIRSATLRENILFGLPFERALYQHTLAVCALEMDLTHLESGDMTILGERGITLSGGQRARVGLARATYSALLSSSRDYRSTDLQTIEASTSSSPTGIVIMDDPLSALDAKTSEAVFQDAILTTLTSFTRVLVTHQTQVLHRCDRIIWMENGTIKATGRFLELIEREEGFRRFIGENSQLLPDDKPTNDQGEQGTSTQINEQPGRELMIEEDTQKDAITWTLYASYTKFSSYWWYFVLMFLLYALSQVANVLWGILFAWWTGQAYTLSNQEWAGIVVSTFITQLLIVMAAFNGVQAGLIHCSEQAGNRALEGVLRAPIAFLDTTPVGRIINRFTQDINTIDSIFPLSVWSAIRGVFHVVAVLGFTIYYIPLVGTIVLPWTAIAILLTLFYRPAPLAIKRIEAPLSSQVLSCISELISGASTLRMAPLAEEGLLKEFRSRIDNLNRIHLTSFACHGWIIIRSNAMSCLIYFVVGLFALGHRRSVIPGILVVLLISCFDVLRSMTDVIDNVSDVQRGLNCVERLNHYARGIGSERERPPQAVVSALWPSSGAIEMRNLSVRYRPELPLVLRDINLSIRSGEKIGIIGRTGAGKSTLLSILLGFTDPCGGLITIDGIDITSIGVRDLRQAVAVIPQEPTLFYGTVRSNLDPRREKGDEELELALQRTGLSSRPDEAEGVKNDEKKKQSRKHTPLHLNTRISPGGENLSSGQRQLLALARAIVRSTRIILIDEATASIDHESDIEIQAMIRSEFADRTVLVIAHRINTVKDYDRIAVLDQGRLVEFGTPRELWDHEGGVFKELCTTSGLASFEDLKSLPRASIS